MTGTALLAVAMGGSFVAGMFSVFMVWACTQIWHARNARLAQDAPSGDDEPRPAIVLPGGDS